MDFTIKGFNSSTRTYDDLDMGYGDFSKLLSIRVDLETDKLEEVEEQFSKFSETSQIFKSMMKNEKFKDDSIQIYEENGKVYMIYCGSMCEDAYSIIIQFMNLLEL